MVSVETSVSLFNMAKTTRKPAIRPPTRRVWRRIYLKQWREKRGLSQEELAEASGVSTGQISLIESRLSAGSPETLEKLAKALDITVGELLDVDPSPDGSLFRTWVHDDDRAAVEAFIETMSRRRH